MDILNGNLEAVEGASLFVEGREESRGSVAGYTEARRRQSPGSSGFSLEKEKRPQQTENASFEKNASTGITHLRDLHLLHEAHAEVLEDDAVRGGEEGENVGDEVLLVIGELLPVLHVVAQVNLLSW